MTADLKTDLAAGPDRTAISPTHELMVTPAMLQAAVQMGPDGRESLALLRQMQIEERVAWAERQYNAALAAFQGECPRILPNRRGAHDAPYADREYIMDKIQPLLTKNGLSVTYGSPVDAERQGEGFTAVAIVRHVDGHSERTPFTVPRENPGKRMNVSQAEGSASEYAMRYALKLALNLRVKVAPGDEDDDGQAAAAPEPVTREQADEIRQHVLELYPHQEGRHSPAGFLARYGTDSFSGIPAIAYADAMGRVEGRRRHFAEHPEKLEALR